MPAARRQTAAQKADALDQTVTVTFDGYDYEVPPVNTWDISILEASEAGAITHALRQILGPKQYTEFRDRVTKVGPMKDFYLKINQAAVGEGNF